MASPFSMSVLGLATLASHASTDCAGALICTFSVVVLTSFALVLMAAMPNFCAMPNHPGASPAGRLEASLASAFVRPSTAAMHAFIESSTNLSAWLPMRAARSKWLLEFFLGTVLLALLLGIGRGVRQLDRVLQQQGLEGLEGGEAPWRQLALGLELSDVPGVPTGHHHDFLHGEGVLHARRLLRVPALRPPLGVLAVRLVLGAADQRLHSTNSAMSGSPLSRSCSPRSSHTVPKRRRPPGPLAYSRWNSCLP